VHASLRCGRNRHVHSGWKGNNYYYLHNVSLYIIVLFVVDFGHLDFGVVLIDHGINP
jgi:hypothetical protein